MKLINYDFHDLYALITFFRSNPTKTAYLPAIKKINQYLDSEPSQNGIKLNTIRKILKPYTSAQDEQLSWVFTENKYTANIFVIKNDACYTIMSAIFRELLLCLGNDPERVYLLCDASHNIPLLLIDEKRPQKTIATMINEYRKRYNSEFLCEELKLL